jgi:hypothetical protein
MFRIPLATLFAITTLTADGITLTAGPVESPAGLSFVNITVHEYFEVSAYTDAGGISLSDPNFGGYTECQQYNHMGIPCSGSATAEVLFGPIGNYYYEIDDQDYPDDGFNTFDNQGPITLYPGQLYELTVSIGEQIELSYPYTPAPFTDSVTGSFGAPPNVQIIVEPEPGSVLLVLSGLIAVAMLRPLSRMRRRLSRFALALIK